MQASAPQQKVAQIQRPVIVNRAGHQFEKNIAGHLNKAGYPSTLQSVSSDNSSVLDGIADAGGEILDDTRDYVGTTMEELAGGATYIREAEGKRGLHILRDKAKKLAQILGLKKKA